MYYTFLNKYVLINDIYKGVNAYDAHIIRHGDSESHAKIKL